MGPARRIRKRRTESLVLQAFRQSRKSVEMLPDVNPAEMNIRLNPYWADEGTRKRSEDPAAKTDVTEK